MRNASGYGYDYSGSLVYETDAAGCRLESAAFSAGRFVREQTQDGTAYVPHYFQCDHLGSLRAISDDSKTVLERNDYYAFGGRWRPDGSAAQNRWLFNGKESQKDFGFGFLDFGARMFDPMTGRWITQDPLAEKYFPFSPYAYCGNNPVLRIDPDGRAWETIWDVANIVMGAQSLKGNIADGNIGGAIVDGLGLTLDVVAAAVPFVPGGVGATIKAARSADKAVDAVKAADIKKFGAGADTYSSSRREALRQAKDQK